ncbi:hypothetical protein JW960_18790 [candidate division KSB1 bacterium]|nr:hypothetical protein [candidate division KSB1 bacterium]
MLRRDTSNDSREAYTGNTLGRRGDVPPQSNSASLKANKAVGDGFNVPEAYTKESTTRRDSGGTVGVREHGMM